MTFLSSDRPADIVRLVQAYPQFAECYQDMTPNVCAVFVEERYRCQGIAGRIPDYVCKDVKTQGDGEEDPSRMYVHREMDQERRPAYYRHDAAGEKIR